MTRSVDDLAADVRAGLTVGPLLSESRQEADAALSELVALVQRAEERAAFWRRERDEWAERLTYVRERREAAEAALAETCEELVRWQTACRDGSVALADMRRALEEIVVVMTTGDDGGWRDPVSIARSALAAAGPAPEGEHHHG